MSQVLPGSLVNVSQVAHVRQSSKDAKKCKTMLSQTYTSRGRNNGKNVVHTLQCEMCGLWHVELYDHNNLSGFCKLYTNHLQTAKKSQTCHLKYQELIEGGRIRASDFWSPKTTRCSIILLEQIQLQRTRPWLKVPATVQITTTNCSQATAKPASTAAWVPTASKLPCREGF